jgi:hypothetical protein
MCSSQYDCPASRFAPQKWKSDFDGSPIGHEQVRPSRTGAAAPALTGAAALALGVRFTVEFAGVFMMLQT